MNAIDRHNVRAALKQADCSWILDLTEDSNAVLDGIINELNDFVRTYATKFPAKPVPNPFTLLEENLDAGSAFFETFTGPPLSVESRIQVWRILMGAQVEALELRFHQQDGDFTFSMVTRFHNEPGDGFQSEGHRVWDFQVVQRLGVGEIEGRPFLGGFYRSGAPR